MTQKFKFTIVKYTNYSMKNSYYLLFIDKYVLKYLNYEFDSFVTKKCCRKVIMQKIAQQSIDRYAIF